MRALCTPSGPSQNSRPHTQAFYLPIANLLGNAVSTEEQCDDLQRTRTLLERIRNWRTRRSIRRLSHQIDRRESEPWQWLFPRAFFTTAWTIVSGDKTCKSVDAGSASPRPSPSGRAPLPRCVEHTYDVFTQSVSQMRKALRDEGRKGTEG